MLKYKRSFFRLSYLICTFAILLVCISIYRENLIYDNLAIAYDKKDVKFGNKISAKDIVKTSNAPYKIIQDIDPNKLGEQEILVELTKNDVTKVIPITVNVVDQTKPVVSLKEETITIETGNSFDVKSNITSVIDDNINLTFKDKPSDKDKEYYTIKSSINNNAAGTYDVEVVAVDRANNTTNIKYKVVVKDKEVVKTYENNSATANNNYGGSGNAPINGAGGDIVSIAYSLVGNPYRSGGNQPGGFDCSGLVQYVYAAAGKSISRSSYTQAYDGVGISYSNVQPGDILIWGHGSQPTHTAVYTGNGQMVHATNPSQGVVVSGVDYWNTHSDARLIGVRRVN